MSLSASLMRLVCAVLFGDVLQDKAELLEGMKMGNDDVQLACFDETRRKKRPPALILLSWICWPPTCGYVIAT
ncbi:hypothetical protein O6H91_01G055200 [Diphasiastrum complanatum]|uniref:Uncharacterized protein n=1 Tax=Diphasiastrum complanatum TaxID=34168 RepID=A0ACC2ERH5_DIPCM|nr:hypothetical protein O6H91_01G055200 [Diphasiastrum complanatum]